MSSIHNLPLLTYDELIAFLSAGVRESFVLDFKRDFPSNLEKTIAAFANTYGGTVLIGVDETTVGTAQLPPCGVELRPGLRERVLQIALDTIYPPVIPDIQLIPFKSSDEATEADRAIVVVRVSESEDAPHAVANRTAVYLRVDAISDRFERRATIGEIEWLINKRQKSALELERILRNADTHAQEFRLRRRSNRTQSPLIDRGQIVCSCIPLFPREPICAPRDLMKLTQGMQFNVPTVPNILPCGFPRPIAEGVLFQDSYGTTEFQQQGLVYHSFDFWWDYADTPTMTRGSRCVPSIVPAGFIWAALELADRMYQAASFAGLLDFQFRLMGVKDAYLRPENYIYGDLPLILDEAISIKRTLSAIELSGTKEEVAKECQADIYWASGTNPTAQRLAQDFQWLGAYRDRPD